MPGFQMIIPITKVDAKQRIVYGAIDETVDTSNQVFDYDSNKAEVQKWSSSFAKATNGKSFGNLRRMHQADKACGKFMEPVFNDAEKRVELAAHVVDDEEWAKVESGVYTGFSPGGKFLKRWKDGGVERYTAELYEVSLVDKPAIPTATFTLIKADGSSEVKHFAKQAADEKPSDQGGDNGQAPPVDPPSDASPIKEPTNDQIAAKARELAKAAGKDESQWASYIETARADLKKTAAAAPQQGKTAEDQAQPGKQAAAEPAARAAKAAGADDWHGLSQGWKTKDGQFFAKKADAVKHQEKLDAAAAASPLAAAVGQLEQAVNKRDGKTAATGAQETARGARGDMAKRDYSADEREAMAKTGEAMEDGSFPIRDKEDLAAAIEAHDRAKDKNMARRHITKRAKVLKATDMLPGEWTGKAEEGATEEGAAEAEGGGAGDANAKPAAETSAQGEAEAEADSGTDEGAAAEGDGKEPPADKPKPEEEKAAAAKAAAGGKLAKSVDLYQVSSLVQLLAQLEWAEEMCEQPGMFGGTSVELTAEVCNEFGALVVKVADFVAKLLDQIIGAIKEEEAEEAMEAAQQVGDLLKSTFSAPADATTGLASYDLEGAKKRWQKMHDTCAKRGAKCSGMTKAAAPEGDDVLAKAIGRADALKDQIDQLTPRILDLVKRVDQLEKTPAAPGPVKTVTVSKEEDGMAAAVERLQKAAQTDPDAVALAMISASHRFPQKVFTGGR